MLGLIVWRTYVERVFRCARSASDRLVQVLKLIQEVEGITEPTPIFFHLDEAQQALPHNQQYLSSLSVDLIRPPGDPGLKLWVVLMITGLRKLQLELSSGRQAFPISLELLNADQCEQALSGLDPRRLSGWKPSMTLRYLLEDLAGPPRLLELFMACVCKAGNDPDAKVRVKDVVDFLLSGAWINFLLLAHAEETDTAAEPEPEVCFAVAHDMIDAIARGWLRMPLQRPSDMQAFFRCVLVCVMLRETFYLTDTLPYHGAERARCFVPKACMLVTDVLVRAHVCVCCRSRYLTLALKGMRFWLLRRSQANSCSFGPPSTSMQCTRCCFVNLDDLPADPLDTFSGCGGPCRRQSKRRRPLGRTIPAPTRTRLPMSLCFFCSWRSRGCLETRLPRSVS